MPAVIKYGSTKPAKEAEWTVGEESEAEEGSQDSEWRREANVEREFLGSSLNGLIGVKLNFR